LTSNAAAASVTTAAVRRRRTDRTFANTASLGTALGDWTADTQGLGYLGAAAIFGGLLLVLVLSWVPFLQAHYAAENRFGAMFFGKVWDVYGRQAGPA
jgi:uncharacterized membrane-anchored protein